MKTAFTFIASALLFSLMAFGQGRGPAGPKSPVVGPDGKVTFSLLAPKATTVTVDGDHPITDSFHGGRKTTEMTKDDKGVWTATVALTPDIYFYSFTVDGLRTLDPGNAHISGNSNWVIVPGPMSAIYEINDVPHGRVSEVWYPSPSLKTTRRMVVYTPPGYDSGTDRYPVFYLLHGGGENELTWSNQGRAPEILDNLIAQGKMVPMIVAMPNFNTGVQLAPVDAPAAASAGGGRGAQAPQNGPATDNSQVFPTHLVQDIIPFMDKNYRTIADRDHRAIAGSSAGGTQTIISGLRHLDQFSWIGLLSPALARVPGAQISIPLPPDADIRRGPDLGVSIDPAKLQEYFPVLNPELNSKLHLLYFSVGGSEGLLEEELAGRRAFDEKGVKYQWMTRPLYGHEWSFWRQDLRDFGSQLFKPAK